MVNNFFKKRDSKQIKISPSILSIPLDKVAEKIEKVENNIEYIHIDVMDGKFVTNLTNGVEMFETAKKNSNKPLDVHLMVENPVLEIEKYSGAEIITFHIEAVEHTAKDVIEKIKSIGAKVGISVKPDTSVEIIQKYFDMIDLILVMTVEPGYGGQKLIKATLSKIARLRELGFNGLIEVDGGINLDNISEIKKEDVDIVVAGTAIFGADDENSVVSKMKENT